MQPWEREPYEPPPPVIHHTTSPLIEGVTVPLLQATITGAFSGLAALAVAAWLGWPFWAVGGTAFALAGLGAWLSYRSRWAWLLERMLGVDINRDGFIGEPQQADPEPVHVRMEHDPDHIEYIDLPARPDQLRQLASGLQGGRQFALTVWAGNGAPFTRPEFDNLRAEMIRRGLARWKNSHAPQQGAELTPAGRAVLRRLAQEPPPYSAREDPK